MSRSYKKEGLVKNGAWITKRMANRRFRRVNKQRINNEKEPYLMYELVNSWDVNDWKIRWRGDLIEKSIWEKRLYKFYSNFDQYKRQYFKK